MMSAGDTAFRRFETDLKKLVAKFDQRHVLDEQIDKLVYELYGLTEDEIKIVEGEKRREPDHNVCVQQC